MDIELRFRKDDIETKEWLINELGISEGDFLEVRPLDGTAIIVAAFVTIEMLIKNPAIIDKFLKREGCEVEFDEYGNLLRAKGYTVTEIVKLILAGKLRNKMSDKA